MRRFLGLVTAVLTSGLLGAAPSAMAPDPNTARPIEALDTVWIEEMTWTITE
jgi:hypothetical protein